MVRLEVGVAEDFACRGSQDPALACPVGMKWTHALTATLVILVTAGCGDPGPPAGASVVSAEDQGTLETNSLIRGRDGGYSAWIDGRSVWAYGDTILSEPADNGSSWRHNSWSWTDDRVAADGITGFSEPVDAAGAPTELFPQTDAEQAFNAAHFIEPCTAEPCGARWALWPGAIVDDPDRSRALVFYSKIYAEPGDFNFASVGSSIAVWPYGDAQPTRPEVSPGAPHPTLLFPEGDLELGSAALTADGMLYAYACGGEGKACRVGRAPLDDVLDRSAWRFWSGDDWVTDAREAVCAFAGMDIASVAWNPALDRYLAVYSEPLGTRAMLRTSPAPEGPWSAPITGFDAMPPDGDGWIYDILPHPELAESDGLVQYMTYSRATGFFQSELRVVRLTLAPAP